MFYAGITVCFVAGSVLPRDILEFGGGKGINHPTLCGIAGFLCSLHFTVGTTWACCSPTASLVFQDFACLEAGGLKWRLNCGQDNYGKEILTLTADFPVKGLTFNFKISGQKDFLAARTTCWSRRAAQLEVRTLGRGYDSGQQSFSWWFLSNAPGERNPIIAVQISPNSRVTGIALVPCD